MSKTQATARVIDFMFMRLMPVVGRLHLQRASFQPAFMDFTYQPPNQSPEPTAVAAAVAIHAASRRWLSFFR